MLSKESFRNRFATASICIMRIKWLAAALAGLVGLASAEDYENTHCYKAIKEVAVPPFNQLYRHPSYDYRCLSRWNFTGSTAAALEK